MAAITLVLLPLAAAGAAPHHARTGGAARNGEIHVGGLPTMDQMNRFVQGRGCTSIERQVRGEDRRYPGTRLDREPPGRLILAVDRTVGGCHEVVLASDRSFGGRR
jgi:hypothetical protein